MKVSDDASIDEQRGLVYSMRVKLARNGIWVDTREVVLMPGMAATAEMQTDKRRIIEFLPRLCSVMRRKGWESGEAIFSWMVLQLLRNNRL